MLDRIRKFISSRSDRNNIVNFNSLSQEHLKADFLKYYFNELSSSSDILQSSAINILADMMSGLLSTLLFKNHQLVREHTITSAVLHDNVIELAKNYGYNINRAVAPTVEVIYLGEPMPISYGFKVGSIDKLDVIYFDKPRIIERGDRFICKLGRLNEYILDSAALSPTGVISINLKPSELKSIEHDSLVVKVNNDLFYPVSRLVEDFMVFEKPVEFSTNLTDTTVFIQDRDRFFGVPVDLSGNPRFTILYLETDGVLEEFNRKTISNITPNFEFNLIDNKGVPADPIDDIRFYSRSLFTTIRRCVTIADYRLVLCNHPYLHSVYIEKDRGLPYILNWFVDDNISPMTKYLVFSFADKLYYVDIHPLLYRELAQRETVYKFMDKERKARYGQTWLTHEEILELVFEEMQKHLDIDITINFHHDNKKDSSGCLQDRVKTDSYISVEIPADSELLNPSIETLAKLEDYHSKGLVHTLDILPESNLDPLQAAMLPHKVIQEPVPPKTCCTLIVYYVSEPTFSTTEHHILTKNEMDIISKYMTNYKGETRLVYIPAERLELDFRISIRLSDNNLKDVVTSYIIKILSDYEYQLDIEFSEDIVLARIASILDESGYLVDGVYPKLHNTYSSLSRTFLSKRYIKWRDIIIDWI